MLILLTDEERDKFASYLEQEATTNAGMAEQMEKLSPEMFKLVINLYKTEVAAMKLVAQRLRITHSETI